MPHALPLSLRISSIFSSAGLHELLNLCYRPVSHHVFVGTPIYTVDLHLVQAVDTPNLGARANLATAFLLLSM